MPFHEVAKSQERTLETWGLSIGSMQRIINKGNVASFFTSTPTVFGPVVYLDFLHALAWAKYTSWTRSCLSWTVFSLETMQFPGLSHGAMHTEGIGVWGSTPWERSFPGCTNGFLPPSLRSLYLGLSWALLFVIWLMSIHRPVDGGSSHLWKLLNVCQTFRCNDPEDSYCHTRLRVNLKSHNYLFLIVLYLYLLIL